MDTALKNIRADVTVIWATSEHDIKYEFQSIVIRICAGIFKRIMEKKLAQCGDWVKASLEKNGNI